MLNRTGREQVCSVVAQFGPRVTAAIAFNSTATVDGQMISLEVTMHTEGWVVTVPRLQIAPAGNTFAPGNLRATTDNPQYKALVDYWISNQYTLRYSGGLVPDIYHILMKGQGVMSNASSKKCRAKLRLLFECAPIALVIEAAGGESCACPSEEGEPMPVMSLLDVPIDHLDRRVGVCFGSAEEVQRFRQHIFA
jgi:sedoheptulose-bisphosphatase